MHETGCCFAPLLAGWLTPVGIGTSARSIDMSAARQLGMEADSVWGLHRGTFDVVVNRKHVGSIESNCKGQSNRLTPVKLRDCHNEAAIVVTEGPG